ncbi:hypothetical protein [Amycolatopsis sp. NPDC051128]|uniref:hypothetical protein n=1 Tax=Amycolatopsis sp. NPDC051128 TaxID=3155412 RepID=UPI00342C46C8
MTGETLTWVIGAFEMTDEDAQRLWAAFAGDAVGPQDGIRDTVTLPRPLGKRQWHRTRTLFEKYHFAGDGSYERRHTLQVIEAIEDGVDSYLFNHEPYADRISVAYGGAVGQHYEYGGGLVSDEIMLGRTLQIGQRIPIEYETHFAHGAHYPSEVRRAVRARVENLDFAIHFAPERRPNVVSFCAWPDHYDGEPVLTEQLTVNDDGSAHRFVSFAEQTVLGFKWAW